MLMKSHPIINKFVLFFVVSVAGCASSPFNLDSVNFKITPESVQKSNQVVGAHVLWGGLIVNTQNLKDSTLIEVLSYPIDNYGEPYRDDKAGARFLLLHPGFIDPAEFAPGRWVSAVGLLAENQQGKVGDTEYIYPVVKIEQVHLWAEQLENENGVRFHFGIGIGF